MLTVSENRAMMSNDRKRNFMLKTKDRTATPDPIDEGIELQMTRDDPTMKAIVQDVYGSAEVLRSAEIDRPAIGDDEVLVRVHAAGLDRGTWHLMAGLPYVIRLGFGFRGRLQHAMPEDEAAY